MIFPRMYPQVLAGTKTQTRRVVRNMPSQYVTQKFICERFIDSEEHWYPTKIDRVDFPGPGVYRTIGWSGGWVNGSYRIDPEWHDTPKWLIGRTYTVQPGVGKKAVGHIWITDIRREQLQDITPEDAKAEGLEPNCRTCGGAGWLTSRIGCPDCATYGWANDPRIEPVDEYADLWDKIHTKPGHRWEDNPEVWVIGFELEQT